MLAPPRPLQILSGQEADDGLPEFLNLPALVCAGLRFTPEQFAELCQANPEAVLELAADGSLILMTPTGSETGARNGELFFHIKAWARASGRWKAFVSSCGFRLPDDSVLSPDASLVALDRWQALSDSERRGFAPRCPDLVVELANPSDEGPRLGWLRLLQPPQGKDLPRIMQWIGWYSAMALNRLTGRCGTRLGQSLAVAGLACGRHQPLNQGVFQEPRS